MEIILIAMFLCLVAMFVVAFYVDKKNKEKFQKALDKKKKVCYNKYVR